jgi:hypothetical protein
VTNPDAQNSYMGPEANSTAVKYNSVAEELLADLKRLIAWIPLELHELPVEDQIEQCRYAWPSWVPDWSLRLDDSKGSPYLFLAGDNWIKTDYQAAGTTAAEVRFPKDTNTLEVRGFLFDRIQSVFPHTWQSVERMQAERTRVRQEWKWYSTLRITGYPYGHDRRALQTAFQNAVMLGRTIMTEKKALPDAEFRFNVFLNNLAFDKQVLKHPELSPEQLKDKITREDMDSSDEENEHSSDSEIAEEDKYYTIDVSQMRKTKPTVNSKKPKSPKRGKIASLFRRLRRTKPTTTITAADAAAVNTTAGDAEHPIDISELMASASLSDREAEWAKALECVNYPGVYFVTQKGYLGRGPLSIKPGDKLCVFLGGRVPFVVREDERGGRGVEEFLLGECCK